MGLLKWMRKRLLRNTLYRCYPKKYKCDTLQFLHLRERFLNEVLVSEEATLAEHGFGDVKRDVPDAMKDVADLVKDVGDHKRDAADVKRDVADLLGDIDDVKRDSDVKRDVPDAVKNVADLLIDIDDVKRNVPDVTKDVTDLPRDVDNVKKDTPCGLEVLQSADRIMHFQAYDIPNCQHQQWLRHMYEIKKNDPERCVSCPPTRSSSPKRRDSL